MQKKKNNLCGAKREKSSFSHALLLSPPACPVGEALYPHLEERKTQLKGTNSQTQSLFIFQKLLSWIRMHF